MRGGQSAWEALRFLQVHHVPTRMGSATMFPLPSIAPWLVSYDTSPERPARLRSALTASTSPGAVASCHSRSGGPCGRCHGSMEGALAACGTVTRAVSDRGSCPLLVRPDFP